MKRYPVYHTFAGSLDDITSKVDLAATYGKVGSAIKIYGLDEMNMILREQGNAEAAAVKFFLNHTGADPGPTASTNEYQLVGTNGAEIEVTVTQNVRTCYPLQHVSGKWLLLEGKGASSTTADLSAFLFSNQCLDRFGSRIQTSALPILATATNLTGSYADVGNIVDIAGLSKLTLYVYNTGDITADIQVYIDKRFLTTASAPTATTLFHRLAGTGGTATTFSTLTTERAAHPLAGASGTYLGIQAKGTGSGTATITAYLTGVAQGV